MQFNRILFIKGDIMNFKKLSAVILSVIFSSSFYSVAMVHPRPWMKENEQFLNANDDCPICLCSLSDG